MHYFFQIRNQLAHIPDLHLQITLPPDKPSQFSIDRAIELHLRQLLSQHLQPAAPSLEAEFKRKHGTPDGISFSQRDCFNLAFHANAQHKFQRANGPAEHLKLPHTFLPRWSRHELELGLHLYRLIDAFERGHGFQTWAAHGHATIQSQLQLLYLADRIRLLNPSQANTIIQETLEGITEILEPVRDTQIPGPEILEELAAQSGTFEYVAWQHQITGWLNR